MIGLVFKMLGLGKVLLGWVWNFLVGLASWAKKEPFQFLSLFFLLISVFGLYKWRNTEAQLVIANNTIIAKQDLIDKQAARLNEYVTALTEQKKVLKDTVDTNNQAVAALKKAADKALDDARKEATRAKTAQQAYIALAKKYSTANPSTGTAEERITREENTTDEFIGDWRKQ